MTDYERRLAEHYLACAGVAAICIDADGDAATHENVGIDLPPDLFCIVSLAGDLDRLDGLLDAAAATKRP